MFPEGRLFDFVIVAAVALIVVGPKDLPVLMRKVGQFMARMRGMAAEFRASFDELARQSELDELRREVEALRSARPIDYAAGQLGAADVVTEINADLASANAALASHEAPQMTSLKPEPEPEPAKAEPTSGPEAETSAEPKVRAS
jgi:sec-independent protein translocase protein TatB